MKKWIAISLAAFLFIALAVRMVYRHAEKVEEERRWYVAQLHYNFSARIDSVSRHGKYEGKLFFRPPANIRASTEERINHQLATNGHLRFIIRPGGKPALITHIAHMIRPGDSIHVSTDQNRITCTRDRKNTCGWEAVHSLAGRPF